METQTVWQGNGFAEGLRWRAGELWFSDMRTRLVRSVDSSGAVAERAFIVGQPSGLGWRPDGTFLVSSMLDGLIVDATTERKRKVASIGDCCVGPINDMIVDAQGRAYVGCLGFDPAYGGLEPADMSPERVAASVTPSPLVRINPDGAVSIAAEGLIVPNGMAFIAGGSVLVVAETPLQRLTAFDVASDGTLSRRRLFAQLNSPVDGICADATGAIWASQLMAEKFVRVAENGTILNEIATPGAIPIACALGGEREDRLFGAVVTGEFGLWSSGRVQSEIRAWDLPLATS